MFSFTATGRIGRIGRIERPKGTDAIVRLSIAADRLVDGPSGKWTKTEWLAAVSFDRALNELLTEELSVGDAVEITGRSEPRKREVGDARITDHSFIVERFKLNSRPKAKANRAASAEERAA